MRIRAHRLGLSLTLLAFAAALAVLAVLLPAGGRLQTGLAGLLPADAQMDAQWRTADAAQEHELNRQILLLLGGESEAALAKQAEKLAAEWQASGLFTRIDSRHLPDIAALRSEWRDLGAALLPPEVVQQLYNDPAAYFRARAEAAFNPFASALLPLDEDWLGFSRYLPAPPGKLQWQAQSGLLLAQSDGKSWAFLRAHLPENPDSSALLDLLERSRIEAHAAQIDIVAGGGALFAAHSRQQAERESTLMSLSGATLTFALLFAVLRSARVLSLLVPLCCGLLCGLAATLAVFGHVHMLTLVIGTSLIGVLIDFPLHWLAPARFTPHWQAAPAMQRLRPVFLASLSITALGYALLWFTPLPVLKQSAVFSTAALASAYAATAFLLPPLFRSYSPRPARLPRFLQTLPQLPRRLLFAAFLLLTLGLVKSDWRDDIRDWMTLAPDLIHDAQTIARISGLESGGQYLLIRAASPDELLRHSARTTDALQSLIIRGELDGVQSLSQWALPQDEQRALHQRLNALAAMPSVYAASGLPVDAIRAALHAQAKREPVSLEASLAAHLGEAWRPLYLGEIEGAHLGIVRLYGLRDHAALASAIADIAPPGAVRLMDKRQHLNSLFTQTRNQAAWLKLASWLGAWLLLAYLFGGKRGSAILALPLASALATLGAFGWLGLPVSLFAMFGLLLAAAIGVDYAVYMLQAEDTGDAKLASITLAALTTLISFAILATSQTPAVASFGLAVSAGVACNWLLAAACLGRANPERFAHA